MPVVLAAVLWAGSERPQVLIAENGALVGVMTDQGRALSKSRGAGFVARVWLENDGERVTQPIAAARWDRVADGVARMRVWEREIVHLTSKRAAKGFEECRADQMIVSAYEGAASGPCLYLNAEKLAGLGSLSVLDGKIITAADQAGRRLWNSPRRR